MNLIGLGVLNDWRGFWTVIPAGNMLGRVVSRYDTFDNAMLFIDGWVRRN